MSAAVTALPDPGDGAAEAAVDVIRERTGFEAEAAIVLGSGLGGSLEIEEEASFSFPELPGFPAPTVAGHAGRLVLGSAAGVQVAAFLGRLHRYEGHAFRVSALPIRLGRLLGARAAVLTAAVGALDTSLVAGQVVVASDHVNLMGGNPLEGWRFPDGSPAFVELSGVYDRELTDRVVADAEALGIRATRGVYVAMPGPSYETPAEAEFLRRIGGTVVGMSVVPEAVPARALGMRVVGLFAVTNTVGAPTTHEDVIRASNEAAGAIGRLLVELLPETRS